MSSPDARLIVWDPDDGNAIQAIDLFARPVLSDDNQAAVIALETRHGHDAEWGNVKFLIEVSPKSVTRDQMMHEVAELARSMGVQVG